jgi:two-component sensor histidine kinase
MNRRAWSIRQRLLLLVAAIAVPMNLLVIASIVVLANGERNAQARNLQYTARTIMSAIDSQLTTYIAIGRALAASPLLREDDLGPFRAEAERAFPDLTNNWLIVSDSVGQQIMNLKRPIGLPLPRRMIEGREVQRRAFETRAMQISDVVRGPVTGIWSITIDFPLMRDDKPFRTMSVVIHTNVFHELLVSQHPPASWLTGIADKRGTFIARLPDHEANVGKPASAGWRAVMDRNGVERFRALEGDMVLNANEISPLSGWRLGIGVKETELAGPVWSAVAASVVASAIVALLSLLLALRLSRGIAGPVAELETKAVDLVAGQAPTLAPSLPEIDRVWQSLQAAVDERAAAERRGQLLTDELTHRVKNTLAIVQAMALQTLRADPDPRTFTEAFSARLGSLARAHDLLTREAWSGAPLEDVVQSAVAPFRTVAGETLIAIQGPRVDMPANTAITLTLMLHELATNAAKHGALSDSQGRVAAAWTVRDDVDGVVIDLSWKEYGGPAVNPPTRQGFGARLLQTGVLQLGGKLHTDFAPSGVVCRLTFRLTAPPGIKSSS